MDLTVCIVRRSCFVQSLFRSSTSRMIMLANLSVVPLCGRKGFTGLQEIDDRLDLVEILAAPGGEAHVALEPVRGLDEEQELDAHRVAEMTKTLV